GAPAFHPGDVADVPANPQNVPQNKTYQGGKESLPPKDVKTTTSSGMDSKPTTRDDGKKFSSACKDSLQGEEEGTVLKVPKENKSSTPSTYAETKKILAAVGFYGNDLELHASQVTPNGALLWARWIAYARVCLPKGTFKSASGPTGVANYRLKKDPTSVPYDMDEVEVWEEYEKEKCERNERALRPLSDAEISEMDHEDAERRARIIPPAYPAKHSGIALNAQEIWNAAKCELELQMTKATFDTWVRPSSALGFDGDTFVVLVHSPYATEWLNNRLSTTILRTLCGIVGKGSIAIRYICAPFNVATEEETEHVTAR
ncbi:partial Chromosomal replication initiator protein DnaA, partial [Anaerolineae bacterium]